jgi:hypothetical protein
MLPNDGMDILQTSLSFAAKDYGRICGTFGSVGSR